MKLCHGRLDGSLCRWASIAVAAGFAAGTAAADGRVKPPAAKMVDHVDDYHGVKIHDPYHWLENDEDPAVIEWLDAEAKFTREQLNRLPQRAAVKKRLETLYSAPSISAPSVVKDRYFFRRREGSQNHAVLYVRDGSYKAVPRVLIDPNTFSADGTIALDWTSISPDARLIAYGKSSSGDEKSTLYIKDVATGKHLGDEIPGTRYASIAWLADGKSFYYTRYPIAGTVPTGDENYNRKVYYHKLGDDWRNDRLVIGDLATKEEMVNPYTNSTDHWMFLSRSVDWSKNDLYLRPITSTKSFRPIAVGLDAQVSADLVYDTLFIRTDLGASRYRIVTVDPADPAPEHWKTLIPEQKGVITSFSVIDHKIIVNLREDAHSRLVVYDLKGNRVNEIKLPTLGTVGGISGEWDDTEIFFSFQSFAYPPSIYRYDLRRDELELIEKTEVDVDVAQFVTTQRWFTSKDGTKVPMFIIHKKGIKLDGDNPTLLYGYGGFDISLTPRFRKGLFVWLERGGVYAVANLRGGGEFGSAWHHAGRLGNKQNVFDDFVAAGEELIKLKYTSKNRLAIYGGSNGGLLVGACLTQRPDLYRAVVCAVPLLDMLRYQNFKIARLWIPEYGSSDDPTQFKWLRAYSPYHNVKDGVDYPATLITTGDSDSRVAPLHAWKMTARLQAATSGDRPILMRMESKAGHGAGKPLSKVIGAEVDRWVFLMHELGMTSEGG